MKYMDRQGNCIQKDSKKDVIYAALYETALGRKIAKVFTKPTISRALGACLDTRVSILATLPYVKLYQVDLDAYKPKYYSSYNDFFTREIKNERRPIDAEVGSFISPADGKLAIYDISEELTVSIKNGIYSVASLLKSKELAEDYLGGKAIVIRLTGEDYHRYCYAASGKKGRNHFINGILYEFAQSTEYGLDVCKENAREFCRIRTEQFGEIIQMEIGATFVGRIVNHRAGVTDVVKGEEKGYFAFGGSTVVVLVKKDVIDFDEDLVENSSKGMETQVKMGERIGYRKEADPRMRFFRV